MADDNPPKLGNTSTDIVASALKGGVGAIPIVGSLVAEIVGNVIPNQRVDRIVRFVQLLEERLGKLEAGPLREKLVRVHAVDILEDGFTQAARATSQERLEQIANVVANGIGADELDQAETKRMLWLLGQLNDAEIIILRSRLAMTGEDYVADAEFQEKHAELLAPAAIVMGSPDEEIEDAALKASYRQHLHDLGLTRPRFSKPRKGDLPEFDSTTGMMKSSGSDVTRLGKMLLKHLKLIPPWYQA